MPRYNRVFVNAFLLISLSVLFPASLIAQTPRLADYAGRYTDGKDEVIYFETTEFGLSVRPVLWTATQLLKPSGKDSFTVVDRASRSATFGRNAVGRVDFVTIRGFDADEVTLKRAGAARLPIELFLDGQGQSAARLYLSQGVNDPDRLLQIAEDVLTRFPTRTKAVIAFLNELEAEFSSTARLHRLLDFANVAAHNRPAALRHFQQAYALDKSDKETISGLARLGALPADAPHTVPWSIPFSLDSVFAKPTSAEIAEVEADWRARDLQPHDIKEVLKGRIDLGQSMATVRLVSHRVLGSRHYGAIIVPDGATQGCCPVVVELKGVSPNYFPLDLNKLHSPQFFGDIQKQFIYVVPSYRGEVLQFEGKSYTSEGDRTDALDGATDDAIALLSVALKTTPEINPQRIGVFGHSRGGNVALLMGIRDPRVAGIVEWAGPTDWFELMGTEGWAERELYAEALRTRATPTETGGQNVERFLMKAIKGEATLKDVRRRMIASSPIYFARRLPPAQLHYGLEDPSVPVRNGLGLVRELKRRAVPASRYQAFFYPRQGHDTDRLVAPGRTRDFLTRILLRKSLPSRHTTK